MNGLRELLTNLILGVVSAISARAGYTERDNYIAAHTSARLFFTETHRRARVELARAALNEWARNRQADE